MHTLLHRTGGGVVSTHWQPACNMCSVHFKPACPPTALIHASHTAMGNLRALPCIPPIDAA